MKHSGRCFPDFAFNRLCCLLLGCGSGSVSSSPSPHHPAPDGSTAIALQTVVTDLQQPLDLEQPNDGSGRLFVVSQAGTIQIIQNGAVLPIPFLDISNLVIDSVKADCWALLSTLDSRRIPAFT